MIDVNRVLARLSGLLNAASAQEPRSSEVRAALVQVEELRGLPPARSELIAKNTPRLHTLTFAERLLAVADEDAAEDPRAGLAWLDIFEAVADQPAFDATEVLQVGITQLTVRAALKRAALLARMGEIADAKIVLRIASHMDLDDPMLVAEFEETQALVHAFLQELPEALACTDRAREHYARIGDDHLVGRVAVRAALAYAESRQWHPAVEQLLIACEKVDPRRDRRLVLATFFNLARGLKECGRSAEALAIIAASRDAFQNRAKRTDRLRMTWLEAGLLAEVGRHGAACETYLRAMQGFAAIHQVPEVSEIALEATETFAAAGQSRRIAPVLALAVEFFRAHGLGQEELGAWIALHQAAAREALSIAAVVAVRKKFQAY